MYFTRQETSLETIRRGRKKTKVEDYPENSGSDKISPRRGRSAKKANEIKKEMDSDTGIDTSLHTSLTSSVEILSVTTRKMKQAKGFQLKVWLKERDILVVPPISRVKPDITEIQTVDRHDYNLWQNLEKDISVCRGNYSRVSNVFDEHSRIIPKSKLVVCSIYNKCIDYENHDNLAHSLIPRDGNIDHSDSFEIMTRAVGDCLLDAISCLVYANQNHSRELRTRLTFKAILNAEWYLMDGNLGINMPQLDTAHSLVERYSLYSGTQAKDYKTTYEQEVMCCFKSGEYCGLWQIHQVSSIIGCPIICLFLV